MVALLCSTISIHIELCARPEFGHVLLNSCIISAAFWAFSWALWIGGHEFVMVLCFSITFCLLLTKVALIHFFKPPLLCWDAFARPELAMILQLVYHQCTCAPQSFFTAVAVQLQFLLRASFARPGWVCEAWFGNGAVLVYYQPPLLHRFPHQSHIVTPS